MTDDPGTTGGHVRSASQSKTKTTKTTKKLKEQAKPKYYIQIATIYERQRKENGEFVDMEPKFYKSWNDEAWYAICISMT